MFMVGTFGAVEEDCRHFPAKPDYFWTLAENQGGASESQRRHTESLVSAQSSGGPLLGGQNELQLNKTIALHLESHGREFLATETRTEFFSRGIRRKPLGGHLSLIVGVPICLHRV